jgi:hypothetical protein
MGLMDMFGKKSPLVDCQSDLSNIAGKLSGTPQMTAEGDFSAWFIPDNKPYLLNRNKVQNPNGMLELKVKVDASYRQAFQDAVTLLAGQTVYASGVLVNDDSKGGKAEIHPLDMLYAPLPADKYPAWFKDIQQNLRDPNAVLVYRIVAASDASKGNKPPRSEETRALRAVFPYPNKPNFPKIKIDFEIRKVVSSKTDFRLNDDRMRQRIELDLSVESIKENGPGVFVGDMVSYWGNE